MDFYYPPVYYRCCCFWDSLKLCRPHIGAIKKSSKNEEKIYDLFFKLKHLNWSEDNDHRRGIHILEKDVLCSTSIHTDIAFYAFGALFLIFNFRPCIQTIKLQVRGCFSKNRPCTYLWSYRGRIYTVNAEYRFFQVDQSPMFWYP